MELNDLELFARVAELATWSAIARERDVAVSQISRAMRGLEARCGASLWRRTTDGLSLTGEGEVFVGYCRGITQMLDDRDS